MSNENKETLRFWQVVAAVVVGLFIFKWINESQFKIDIPGWVFIAAIVLYIVGGALIQHWREVQEFKEIDRRHLAEVKQEGYHSIEEWHAFGTWGKTSREWQELAAKKNGFKNFDEYMMCHARDEKARKEWESISTMTDEHERETAMRAYDKRRKEALGK